MAHEQAELSRFDPKLGPRGTLVSMEDVEAAYKTSAQANLTARYVCADCKVRVHAVIPSRIKPGRKRSPSPYFSSSPNKHKRDCTRRPKAAPPSVPTTRTMAGRSRRGDVPAKWNELITPIVPAPGSGSSKPTGAVTGGASKGVRVTTPGSGSSIPSTGLVEKVARAWLGMSATEAAAEPFEADWNPQGTYQTAFIVAGPKEVTDRPVTPERIYVGEIATVAQGKSGYILTLATRHGDGSELKVWLQNALQTAPAGGAQLWKRLQDGNVVPGMLIFALGAFAHQAIGPGFFSLPVIDSRKVWIVTDAEVQALLEQSER